MKLKRYKEFLNESDEFDDLQEVSPFLNDEADDIKYVDLFEMNPKFMDNVLGEDDLNMALYDLQTEIGQQWGDNAGLFFSGNGPHDEFGGLDAEDWWEQASYEERKEIIKDYLNYEEFYRKK